MLGCHCKQLEGGADSCSASDKSPSDSAFARDKKFLENRMRCLPHLHIQQAKTFLEHIGQDDKLLMPLLA